MYTTHALEPVGSSSQPDTAHQARELPITSSRESLLDEPSALPTTLQLRDPGNVTACSSLTLFWSLSSARASLMTLFIIDWHNPTSANPPTPLPIAPSSSKVLAVNLPSDWYKYTWDTVDVSEGWYVVGLAETGTATTGISTRSSPFYVTARGDSLCQYDTSLLSVSRRPMPSHHPAPRPLRPADLAGIVLCAVFGVCVLAAAFLFPRLWRRSLPSPKRRRSYIWY